MKFKNFNSGLTLIELMVVAGILAILLSIVVIAINPIEQFAKAKDLTRQAAVHDLVKSSNIYYAQNKSYPWDNNIECLAELGSGGLLSNMSNCLLEMTGWEIEGFTEKELAKFNDIQVSKCKESAVMCYLPSSKEIINESSAKYDKFGVNNPGCPGTGEKGDCYWCKPVNQNDTCEGPPPTPTPIPNATPTPIPNDYPQIVPGYENDETKLLRTSGVFLYDYPGFDPEPSGIYRIDISLRSDFGGDYTETKQGFDHGTLNYREDDNLADVAFRLITDKQVAFTPVYNNSAIINSDNCGKTIYYRIRNGYPIYPEIDERVQYSQTLETIYDCETIVGVVAPPLSTYQVMPYWNPEAEYEPLFDFDENGVIDWVDYWLGAFSRKFRSGGWEPPE